MVSIQIQKGQGLSQAIKTTLTNNGVDTSKIDGSVWTQILGEVSNDNENNKKNSKPALFQGGNDIKGSTRKNFVVKPNQTMTIDDASWNKIVSFTSAKTAPTAETKQAKKTEAATVVDTPAVKAAKAGCAEDLAAFKASGINVSDWNNNTCTLSYKGKTATINIDSNGKPSFGGEINYMMDHLQSSSPAEQASVDNQNKFFAKMKQQGYTDAGNSQLATIKVGGKDISAVKYTFTKDGKTYVAYLNNDGQEVKADK